MPSVFLAASLGCSSAAASIRDYHPTSASAFRASVAGSNKICRCVSCSFSSSLISYSLCIRCRSCILCRAALQTADPSISLCGMIVRLQSGVIWRQNVLRQRKRLNSSTYSSPATISLLRGIRLHVETAKLPVIMRGNRLHVENVGYITCSSDQFPRRWSLFTTSYDYGSLAEGAARHP